MLSCIREHLRRYEWSQAVELCQRNEFLFQGNMLFHACYAKALVEIENKPAARRHLLYAVQSRGGNYNLALVCYKNLCLLGGEHDPIYSNFPISHSFTILTMTSCKRLSLLERTLRSIIKYLDISHVDKILIVDDGSPVESMNELIHSLNCPRIEVYYKPTEARGHAKSMNWIRDYLTTNQYTYAVHLEDDFEFFYPLPLIAWSIQVLEEFPEYGQCLFNHAYLESLEESFKRQTYGIPKMTSNGLRFYEHEFNKDKPAPTSYWPHFSLRPGVNRVHTWQSVGKFIESGSFEKDYALRYMDKGWKTAYLESPVSEHIGRKTKDRHGSETNAYDLNQTMQFGRAHFRAFMVHLDRRTDRLKALVIPPVINVTLYSAVDGSQLTPHPALNGLFRNNIVDMKPGIIGCALSHIKLWMKLATEYEKVPQYLVLEDDIQPVANFDHLLNQLLNSLAGQFTYWDVVFIGYFKGSKPLEPEPFLIPATSFTESFKISVGGTFGYLINGAGAQKLLSFIATFGMVNAIDTVMQRCADYGLKIFYVSTPLIESVMNSTDSDIQRQETSLYDESLSRAEWSDIVSYIQSIN